MTWCRNNGVASGLHTANVMLKCGFYFFRLGFSESPEPPLDPPQNKQCCFFWMSRLGL